MVSFKLIFCLLACANSMSGSKIVHKSNRVIGGQDSTIAAHPSAVSIRVDGNHLCGGTLVKPQFVLSSAGCVKGVGSDMLRVTVVMGATHLDDTTGVTSKLALMLYHGQYNNVTHANDIGVFKLDKPVSESANVKFATLSTDESRLEGKSSQFAGWGLQYYNSAGIPNMPANTLQEITLNILSRNDCSNYYVSGTITQNNICTQMPAGKGLCLADIGGGLMLDNKLAGISSFFSPCAKGSPDVFTKIISYADWISNVLIKYY